MHVNRKHVVGALALVVGGLLVGSGIAGADARSDLDSRKRDFENLKRELDGRKGEVDKYLENSRLLRSFDKDEMEKLIKAMCAQDVERDGDEAERINKDLGDRAIDTVRRKWDDVTREWDGTEDRTERTLNDLKSFRDKVKYIPEEDAVKSERSSLLDQVERALNDTDRLYAKLQDDYRSLSNVKEGIMNGANNPKIRASMEYGKRKHSDMQSSYSCDEREVVLSSGRADCVKFKRMIA